MLNIQNISELDLLKEIEKNCSDPAAILASYKTLLAIGANRSYNQEFDHPAKDTKKETPVKIGNRFCPSWAQRDLIKGDIAIHRTTGAMFQLNHPELSQGGWKFKGWATTTYGGRVNTEYSVPQNVLSSVGSVESFGAYSSLVKPNKEPKMTYNPGEWLIERTMKTIGQHNYACKKKHLLGLV